MNLFDNIPENFFNPLSSSSNNRQLSDLLVLVYSKYESELSYSIKRDDVKEVILNYLVNQNYERDTVGTADDKANEVIRKFIESGWVVEETDDLTYEKTIQMTEPGVALAEFVRRLIMPEREEYALYIIDIYKTLGNKDSFDEPYSWCIKPVFDKSKELSKALKKLSTSMRKIIEELSDKSSFAELTENIVEYCDGSFIKEYSRLIKKQNIHVFQNGIRNELNKILNDDNVMELIAIDYGINNGNQNASECMDIVTDMIQETIEFFSVVINSMIRSINEKINIYLDLAVSRARFLMNNDEDIQSYVEKTVRFMAEHLSAVSDNKELPDEMTNMFSLYTQELVDEKAIKYPVIKRTLQPQKNTDNVFLTEKDKEIYADKLKQEIYNPFSKDRIKKYTQAIMGDKNMITACDFPLETKEDVLCVIAASVYAEENGYTIVQKDDYLQTESFVIHNFEIKKAGGHDER